MPPKRKKLRKNDKTCEDSDYYEIEKIVDKRVVNERVEYLVQWYGYSSDVNSWEPTQHLKDCDQVIKEYETRLQDITFNESTETEPSITNRVKRIKLFQFHYLNEETKDVTFIISGQQIPGHKTILSSMSDVFHRKFKESNDNEIQLKDTSIETFKLFLKFIYFDELNANDLKDYFMTIEVLKLSLRYKIKLLSDMIEEELIKMITFDNLFVIFEFVMSSKLQKLLDAIEKFIKQNETQLIANIEEVLIEKPIETAVKFVNLLNISQNELIAVLNKIRDKNTGKDLTKYRVIIKFELCSIKNLNALKNIGLFDSKVLDKAIENKHQDLQLRYLGLSAKYERIKVELQMFKKLKMSGPTFSGSSDASQHKMPKLRSPKTSPD